MTVGQTRAARRKIMARYKPQRGDIIKPKGAIKLKGAEK